MPSPAGLPKWGTVLRITGIQEHQGVAVDDTDNLTLQGLGLGDDANKG